MKMSQVVGHNPESCCAHVRSKTKVKDAVGPLINSEGAKVTDREEMCSVLNEYFGSVFTEEMGEDMRAATNPAFHHLGQVQVRLQPD